MFQAAAWLITQFYALVGDYAIAVALVAVTIMLIITPLTLKSTKGMLEMQRLQPEMKRLQQQYRGDRQKLNEEMMKLYQEHKVNPLASCLPLLAQMPIFIIMFRVLHGITDKVTCSGANLPHACVESGLSGGESVLKLDYISKSSELYRSLVGKNEMVSFGLDMAARPFEVMRDDPGKGIIYALLVALLGALYLVQQKMIASRTTSATMSPAQQKLMQYLPVFFAVFQLFFPVALVIYYITQTLFRIGQQSYITRRFYHGEHSLGRQAQAAGVRAREMTKADGSGGAPSAQAKQDAARGKARDKAKDDQTTTRPAVTPPGGPTSSKRVTPPKDRPTPTKGRPTPPNRPKPSGSATRPKPTRPPK